MGHIRTHRPVLLITAVFSRYDEAIEWAKKRLEAEWGPVALASEVFTFHETRFYERTMGANIKKLFWAFERLIDPARLVEMKHQSNQFEDDYRNQTAWPEQRPVNLDPGYLTEAKLVLASTKDRDHRIYLDRGIFAEETLFFQHGAWREREWTYPDYRRADYHQFFTQCRDYLRQRYQAAPTV
jgi:hypothetical protein